MIIDYTAILVQHFSNDEWILNGDSYEGLVWLSDTAKPSQAELDAMYSETLTMIEEERQAKIDARQQALAKLEALGLTVDEVALLFGS